MFPDCRTCCESKQNVCEACRREWAVLSALLLTIRRISDRSYDYFSSSKDCNSLLFITDKELSARKRRGKDSAKVTEPDLKDSRVVGELAVHRESLSRVLRENPESLVGILEALVSA